MAYVARAIDMIRGKRFGDGSAVALVEATAMTPPPGLWRPGAQVVHNWNLSPGTAVAMFVQGHYTSAHDCHVGLYVTQGPNGIILLDQGDGNVASDTEYSLHGDGDASKYYVIE